MKFGKSPSTHSVHQVVLSGLIRNRTYARTAPADFPLHYHLCRQLRTSRIVDSHGRPGGGLIGLLDVGPTYAAWSKLLQLVNR